MKQRMDSDGQWIQGWYGVWITYLVASICRNFNVFDLISAFTSTLIPPTSTLLSSFTSAFIFLIFSTVAHLYGPRQGPLPYAMRAPDSAQPHRTPRDRGFDWCTVWDHRFAGLRPGGRMRRFRSYEFTAQWLSDSKSFLIGVLFLANGQSQRGSFCWESCASFGQTVNFRGNFLGPINASPREVAFVYICDYSWFSSSRWNSHCFIFLFSALLKRKVMTREFISHLLLGVASIVAVYCISHNVNIDGSRVTIKRSVEQRGLKAHM